MKFTYNTGKVGSERWNIAQDSEKEFWGEFTEESMKEMKKNYERKTQILFERWFEKIKINKNTRILQIGCGPFDIINCIKIGKKYSIDPLSDFYKKRFNFDYKKANLKKGIGESLPFQDKFFDIVILANVLDHTQSPDKVLSEIKRVLKEEGVFYIENYFYQETFILLAKIWRFINKKFRKRIFNIHHPYMFSLFELKKIIFKYFIIDKQVIGEDLYSETNNIYDLRKKMMNDKKLIKRILAVFGLIGGINYTAIYRKNN